MTEEHEHTWIEGNIPCEVCGAHEAVYCPGCCKTVDLVYDDDPRAARVA